MVTERRGISAHSRLVAAIAWALVILLGIAAAVLATLNGAWSGAAVVARVSIGLSALMVVSAATVGALVVAHRPGNIVGWLFLGTAGALAFLGAANAYARYGLETRPGSVPGATAAAWISDWGGVAAGTLLVLILLYFPNGKLPSPRWRPLSWLIYAAATIVIPASAIAPRELWEFPIFVNPLGLSGPAADLFRLVMDLGWFTFVLLLLAAVLSLLVRLLRSTGEERQQLKLFVYAACIAALPILVSMVFNTWSEAVRLLVGLGMAGLPIAAGIAILRYRLYDIDLLINRTLVYGVLSATLAAVYIGLVIALQGLLSGFTGGNSLAVAASTLTVAALFQPVRRRIQNAVDRRFYRSRYDAQRTLEAFSSRLRHEVDLAHLTDELRGVVSEALQPASVSVWLREGGVR